MQQTAAFCKELSPTKTEHLMNRAREELYKLEKVIKTKQLKAKKRTSSPEQEQTKNKAEVDVSSLVKAKKNEMCVSDENDLKMRMKEKKKKHKSKSKDYISENNELNNTLSLGLHVNIELANSTNEKNDVILNPRHVKTTIMKHASKDLAPSLKEKTEKTKSHLIKKQKGTRQANSDTICRTMCQNLEGKEAPEIIAGNQENLGKNNIDLLLNVIKSNKTKKHKTVNDLEETICTAKKHSKKKSRRESSPLEEITCYEKKTDKRKKHKAMNELEGESICHVKEHRKKKFRRESSPLEEVVCPEKIESSQSKRHKKDRKYYDNIIQQEERQNNILVDSLLEMTEHKSKRKKKKHKEVESEDVDKYSEGKSKKYSNNHEDGSLHVDCNDIIKKTKKKRTVEYTESLEHRHNDVMYCSESLVVSKSKKHKHSRNAENVNGSLTSDSSDMFRTKRKKHKDAKESEKSCTEASYGELKDNTLETTITETENCYSSESPHKRKRKKRKESTVEMEISNAEISANKKKKEKLEIADKQKRKKHREDINEFVEPVELQTKSKKRKFTEEEVMQNELELTESKQKKERKHVKNAKSSKHEKKGDGECKDVEDTDHSSENNKEINTNEASDFCSAEFLKYDKKVKKKRKSFNEIDELQNALLEGVHQMENMHVVDSVVTVKNSEHKRRQDGEPINATDSNDCENGKRKKKSKKSKSKEQEKDEISSEMNSSYNGDICEQSGTSQNILIIETPPCKANTTFGRSPMERLLFGGPETVVTETCTHCLQCSQHVTSKPSPVVKSVNIKQEKTETPQLQADAVKPCIVDNIVNTIVIKKEPGLEIENSNSEVIEPIHFIDINNIKIKQEPGLETETPSDQANEAIQLNLPKDHEQQLEFIKKEPGSETQNNSNAAVSSTDMVTPEAEQPLSCLKKEHAEEHNTNTESAATAEAAALELQNTPAEDTYLNSVISAEEGASGFFRHASTNANDIATSEENVHEGKTVCQELPASSSADTQKREAGDNVPDTARYVATPPKRDLFEHELSRKKSSFNSEMSLVEYKQSERNEEWIYELHLIDVPYKVHFHHIADYFRIPLSKVKEYRGYGRRRGYKHVVVALSNYSLCLRMSKKRRLFGSRHTFIWSFKKYTSRDS